MAKKRTLKRPWNKGFEIGQKDALTPAQVKQVRHILARRGAPALRDLALFSVAIDTMPRIRVGTASSNDPLTRYSSDLPYGLTV